MSPFQVEMGKGFAFVGRQVHFEQDENDYFIDLLLYHLKLHCYVILELKVGDFKPEYTGKMNFYLSLIDEKLKSPVDHPSIGLILCKNKSNVTVEYALRGVQKPIGVADYEVNFTKAIPENLKGDPTIEDLENELQKEVEILKRPVDEKIEALKNFVSDFGKPEVAFVSKDEIKDDLFTHTLTSLENKSALILKDVAALFKDTWIVPMCNENVYNDMEENGIMGEFQLVLEKDQIKSIGLYACFNGLKFGGANVFLSNYILTFCFDNFKYSIGPGNPLKDA